MNLYLRFQKPLIFYSIQTVNLINLAFFKYFYFLADQISALTGIEQWSETVLRAAHREAGYEILLPLAISFYTFEIISYGFDLRRGVYHTRHSFVDVLLFISFFPKMIAGPIMRSSDLLPQIAGLHDRVKSDPDNLAKGIWLILIGIIKKIFIADSLQRMVGVVINQSKGPDDLYPHDLWVVVFSLLMMLYADFSAYSDMARGFGLLFGISIPVNFRAPFKMHSFTELWKRWHITFSSWIRDYIFIPLGGSKRGEVRLYFNLIFTFLLAGFWHGASLAFGFWGLLMGVFLSVEAFLARRGYPDLPESGIGKIFRISLVWIVYISTGVFFFAPNWQWAVEGFVQMFDIFDYGADLKRIPFDHYVRALISFLVIVVFQSYEEMPSRFAWLRRYEAWLLPVIGFAVIIALSQVQSQPKDFFYFQF